MQLDLDQRRFTTGEVCAAVGIAPATLKNWVSREPAAILLAPEDRQAAGEREYFRFSFRRCMQVAIVANLVALGFKPSHAGMLAAGFTDVGDGAGGWVGGEPISLERLPGQLYPNGLTVLVAYPGQATADVRCLQLDKPFNPFFGQGVTSVAATLLDLTHLQWTLLARLGFDKNGQPIKP